MTVYNFNVHYFSNCTFLMTIEFNPRYCISPCVYELPGEVPGPCEVDEGWVWVILYFTLRLWTFRWRFLTMWSGVWPSVILYFTLCLWTFRWRFRTMWSGWRLSLILSAARLRTRTPSSCSSRRAPPSAPAWPRQSWTTRTLRSRTTAGPSWGSSVDPPAGLPWPSFSQVRLFLYITLSFSEITN